MRDKKPTIDVFVDASLTGMGYHWDQHVYSVSRPILHTLGYSITQLEMSNVLIAMRCFCRLWAKKAVTFHVDNKAVVYSLSTGRIKNKDLSNAIT